MKTVQSRQKALSELALSLGEMESYRGHSQESLNLIWPYCNSDSIVLYRLVDGQNLMVVSHKGRLTPHQTAHYDSINIDHDIYKRLVKGNMLTFDDAYAMGLRLPALQEDGIKSGLIFPVTVGDKIEAIIVFISYSTDTWPQDTIEWIEAACAIMAYAVKRTVIWEGSSGAGH